MSLNLAPEIIAKYPSIGKAKFIDGKYVESNDGREEALLAYLESRAQTEPLQNNPALILQAMDDFAASSEFLINIGSDKTRVLDNILAQHKPKILIEAGGYVAYSAIFFADRIRTYHGAKAHVWSLEYEPKFAVIMEKIIEMAGLSAYVTVVVGSADESMRKLKKSGEIGSVDLLFLDHVEGLYEQDFKVAVDELGLLESGGMVLADNVLVPGAPEYVKFVRARKDLRSEGVPALIVPGDIPDEIELTFIH
ncbi:S-adenosyl-L-methionine-dependent methyltransferase [Pseudovirgaria hyperparasitica]|uniref:catechol O-methyltransferase n=1 Tax=Pseudovirgaria hyperparasitica TaxID=470096 RepID=A0A6A6W893_9PEZI|nr:S-adenosyl-L-methionine-dependent methyltransferase [Pseudovirgaria hyperparasitica]KAF2758429.1 S-adenosyl-L-methionine-dependent methyltransferase [Pseudovirgaria hyperparasitica]